jgi:hypothetical protein
VHARDGACPQAHCLSHLAEHSSGVAAHQAAGECATAMATRIELPSSDYLIRYPVRTQRILHQADHPFF